MRWWATLAICGIALVAGLVGTAWACSCVAVVGKDALPAATAMFSATATKVIFLESEGTQGSSAKEPPIVVTLDVHEVWKGPVRRSVRLRTTYNKWTCEGYYFREGVTYLVTTYGPIEKERSPVPELSGVNPCGGTFQLTRGQADVDAVLRGLGPGRWPEE